MAARVHKIRRTTTTHMHTRVYSTDPKRFSYYYFILQRFGTAFNAAILIWRRKINWYGFLRHCGAHSAACLIVFICAWALMGHNTDRLGTGVAFARIPTSAGVITAQTHTHGRAALSLSVPAAAPRCCLRHKKVSNSPRDRSILSGCLARRLHSFAALFAPLPLIAFITDKIHKWLKNRREGGQKL
jgi:hypothetical protein